MIWHSCTYLSWHLQGNSAQHSEDTAVNETPLQKQMPNDLSGDVHDAETMELKENIEEHKPEVMPFLFNTSLL